MAAIELRNICKRFTTRYTSGIEEVVNPFGRF